MNLTGEQFMGEMAWLEYYCFAKYVELFGQLPEFNDKKNAPKLTASQINKANRPLKT